MNVCYTKRQRNSDHITTCLAVADNYHFQCLASASIASTTMSIAEKNTHNQQPNHQSPKQATVYWKLNIRWKRCFTSWTSNVSVNNKWLWRFIYCSVFISNSMNIKSSRWPWTRVCFDNGFKWLIGWVYVRCNFILWYSIRTSAARASANWLHCILWGYTYLNNIFIARIAAMKLAVTITAINRHLHRTQ
jgi:hypothetical protein